MLTAMLLALANPVDHSPGPEWQPIADVGKEFEQDLLECDSPNHVVKTCEGLARYSRLEDGMFSAVVLVPINNEPDLTIAMPVSSWIDGDTMCFKLQQADFDRMTILLGKKKYEKPAGQKLLAAFRDGMADMIKDKLVCSRYYTNGDRRYSVVTIDGDRDPESDGEWAWLKPDTDYDLRASENLVDE